MQENAEFYRERRQERIKQRDHDLALKRNMRCDNEKSNEYVQKNRRVAYEEIFHTLLMTVEYVKSHPQASSEQKDDEINVENWQIMKSEGEEVYELCPPVNEETSLPEHVTAESSLTEPESDAESMDITKNLTLIFNQPEMMAGTQPETISRAESEKVQNPHGPSLQQEELKELKRESSFYYFRGEILAKAEEKSHEMTFQSSHPQGQQNTQKEATEVSKKVLLLDTSRALPNMLKPPSLCQAVTMVLEVGLLLSTFPSFSRPPPQR